MFESSCLYWHEENEIWTGEGCKVKPFVLFRLGSHRSRV
jgi:hypothetical protein